MFTLSRTDVNLNGTLHPSFFQDMQYFGLVTVNTNIQLEAQEEMKAMELGIKDDESKK